MNNSEIFETKPKLLLNANLKSCEKYINFLKKRGIISTINFFNKNKCEVKILYYKPILPK